MKCLRLRDAIRNWSTVPTTKSASNAFLLPWSHGCIYTPKPSSSSSINDFPRIICCWYSLLNSAPPCAKRIALTVSSDILKAHSYNRSYRPFAVACVGIPKNTPLQWHFDAITSAAPRAASVFPTPIWASSMNIPGSFVSSTAFKTASWTSFGRNPNLAWKICLLMLHTSGCHTWGRCNLAQPLAILSP